MRRVASVPAVEPVGRVRPDRTLYVGNLPYDCTVQEVETLINGVVDGQVVRVHLPTDPDGRKRGFGFVTMASTESAKTASEQLRTADIRGRRLVVNLAHPKGERPERPGWRRVRRRRRGRRTRAVAVVVAAAVVTPVARRQQQRSVALPRRRSARPSTTGARSTAPAAAPAKTVRARSAAAAAALPEQPRGAKSGHNGRWDVDPDD